LFFGVRIRSARPPNEAGVTLGHIHLVVKDVDTQKRFWTVMMGGTAVMNDRLEMIQFPGVYILLRQGAPAGPPAGSIVDHFGFAFRDLPVWLAKWKAAGIEIEQGQNPLQGYVHAPDGVRVEFFGDPALDAPVKMDHIHFWPSDTPAIQAWYAHAFGESLASVRAFRRPAGWTATFFRAPIFLFHNKTKSRLRPPAARSTILVSK
jgi:catechol 2,3-dioxygenase-like lactoylglutathione lyase family enzyme